VTGKTVAVYLEEGAETKYENEREEKENGNILNYFCGIITLFYQKLLLVTKHHACTQPSNAP
jgi:hypothetical protein